MKVRNQFALASYIIALPYFISSDFDAFVLFVGVVLYISDLYLIRPYNQENTNFAVSVLNRLIWVGLVLPVNYCLEGKFTGYAILLIGLELYIQYLHLMAINDDIYEEGLQEVFADTLNQLHNLIGDGQWQEFVEFYNTVDEEKMIKFVLMYYPHEIKQLLSGDRIKLAKCINEEKYDELNSLLSK